MTTTWNSHSFLACLLWAQAEENQPDALFGTLTKHCAEQFGFTFLTILKNLDDGRHIQRLYSSEPDYPVGALKPMGGTPWGHLVLDQGKSWLGNGSDDILWAFPDAKLILSKGCEACACAPILWNGKTLGVLSLNAELDRYSEEDLAQMQVIAQTLAPALLAAPVPHQKDSTTKKEVAQ